jgi:hypothetical protein
MDRIVFLYSLRSSSASLLAADNVDKEIFRLSASFLRILGLIL